MAKKQKKVKHSTRNWCRDVIFDNDVVVYFAEYGDKTINVELSTGDGRRRLRLSLTEKEKVLLALEAKRKELRIKEKQYIEVYSPEKKPQGWQVVVKQFKPILEDIGIEDKDIERRVMVLPQK